MTHRPTPILRTLIHTLRTALALSRDTTTLAPDGTPDPNREAGMATAEYAICTLAAAAFAILLLNIARSDGLRGALEAIFASALSVN